MLFMDLGLNKNKFQNKKILLIWLEYEIFF